MISPQDTSARIGSPRRGRGRAFRLALKELRETLRDRRTLVTLILMPLLVYPLLGVILQKALLSAVTEPSEPVYAVAFCSYEDARRFQDIYQEGNRLLPEETSPMIEIFAPETEGDDCRAEKLIRDGVVDLAILLHEPAGSGGEPSSASPPEQLELVYGDGNPHALTLVLAVKQRLRALNNDYTTRVLQRYNDPSPPPMDVALTPVKREATPQFSLATFVPLMLILMTVTGAVYPAIDLTAGERERGTLEVLVAAPVPRMELLGAKFVAVLCVAMLTAVVNLIAMLITVYASGLESLIFGDQGFSWMVMGQILALLCLFAAFFSSVLLAITSFARSFKEAQAYLIPLMLVALAPGIFSLTPGLKMNGLLAVTPLVNIVLLGRDLLEGTTVPWLFAGAVLTTILYALLALALAARVFGSDAILYGSQGNIKDLFRRPEQPQPIPTLTQVMLALAVLFPAFVIFGSLPGRFSELAMSNRLALSASVTILLFVGWPAFLTWQNALLSRTTFRLARPGAWSWLVAVLWGVSLWMWAYELEILTLSHRRIEALQDVFELIKRELEAVPLAWRLVTLAAVPAVCEELFFRGYLLSGLRARMPAVGAVVLSAALFGLFHVMVRDVLFFERFVPSSFLGLMLGWLAVRAGSVWPGMLLHVLHNGLLLSIAAYQTDLMEWGLGLENRQHLPWTWLAGSGALVLMGAVVLMSWPTKESAGQEDQSDTGNL